MATQWNRFFTITLDSADGYQFTLGELRVVFSIRKQPYTIFPGSVGVFRIYNPSEETANQLMNAEFANVKLYAGYYGYQDEFSNYPDQTSGLMFMGGIRFARRGKDDAATSWVEVEAIDGWEGCLKGRLNQTVAKGYTENDLVDIGVAALQKYGISAGNISKVNSPEFPRGRALYTTVMELLEEISYAHKCYWWIEDNQVHMQPLDEMHKSTAPSQNIVELNSDTGMVGMPTQTMGGGIEVRCLINPNIKLGDTLRINQRDIIRAQLTDNQVAGPRGGSVLGGQFTEEENNGNLSIQGLAGIPPSAINADGDYIVGKIDYTGDTRGRDWYMDMLCVAKGSHDYLSDQARSVLDPNAASQ
ncbi:hypothetical protein R84981_002817 [Carnimonas sp. R-84981]|uniref:hypothetical protein n=1 Tax=Carnimonas bestiolae TaxID=3402172 RepID=UPI003EDC845C